MTNGHTNAVNQLQKKPDWKQSITQHSSSKGQQLTRRNLSLVISSTVSSHMCVPKWPQVTAAPVIRRRHSKHKDCAPYMTIAKYRIVPIYARRSVSSQPFSYAEDGISRLLWRLRKYLFELVSVGRLNLVTYNHQDRTSL